MNRTQELAPIGLCVALLCASAAQTTFADNAVSGLLGGLKHCAAIVGRDARLACYDALASQPATLADNAVPAVRPSAPSPAPAPIAASAAPAQVDRPENFGLSAQSIAPSAQISSITARVVGFGRDNNSGNVIVKLDNGQSWELAESDPLLAAGDSVTIRRAALGSFMLKTPTGRTHKAHRTL